MALIDVKGRPVEYELTGSGDTVVLCQPTWWPLDPWKLSGVPELSQRHRLLLFNHRGIGKTPGTDSDYTIAGLAADTVDLMDVLGINRAHLVCFANGTMVALAVAQDAPDRVRSLVLGAPGAAASDAPRQVSEGPKRAIERDGYEGFIKGHAANDDFAFNPEFYREHRDKADALADALWKGIGTQDEYFKHALARTSFDNLSRIGSVTQPALIVTGSEDTVARGDSNPLESSKKLASLMPDARLELIPSVRHMVYWEAPERCWTRVLAFVEKPSS